LAARGMERGEWRAEREAGGMLHVEHLGRSGKGEGLRAEYERVRIEGGAEKRG
jgi:hypothetical protein